jgi:enoyl-CoA hydratase/carnithine racemase
MEPDYLEQTTALVVQDFGLVSSVPLSEAELLEAIAQRVAELMEGNKDLLLSYMYRLDIDEGKIHFALSPLATEPTHLAMARLILNRQKQRAITKLIYKSPELDEWEF